MSSALSLAIGDGRVHPMQLDRMNIEQTLKSSNHFRPTELQAISSASVKTINDILSLTNVDDRWRDVGIIYSVSAIRPVSVGLKLRYDHARSVHMSKNAAFAVLNGLSGHIQQLINIGRSQLGVNFDRHRQGMEWELSADEEMNLLVEMLGHSEFEGNHPEKKLHLVLNHRNTAVLHVKNPKLTDLKFGVWNVMVNVLMAFPPKAANTNIMTIGRSPCAMRLDAIEKLPRELLEAQSRFEARMGVEEMGFRKIFRCNDKSAMQELQWLVGIAGYRCVRCGEEFHLLKGPAGVQRVL